MAYATSVDELALRRETAVDILVQALLTLLVRERDGSAEQPHEGDDSKPNPRLESRERDST